MRSSMKKVLAIALSVLMIATTMPFTAVTALADDAAITAYNSAVDAYLAKMNGTVYTTMGTAYAAYVDANEAYDAYVYGQGTASALTNATNALVTATNDLTAWTRSTATASVYSRDSDTPIGASYAKNILYADRQDTLVDENSNNTKNVRVQIQYGANNVLMYDGTNDILFPVAVFYYYDQTGFSSRKMFTMYPSNGDNSQLPNDSSEFKLQGQWNGSMDYGTADWNYAYQQSDRIPGYEKASGLTPDNAPAGNRNKWNYFANYMKYVGGASGFSDGLKTVQPSWYAFTGYSSSNNRVDHYLNNAGNIYIIDYATPLAAINTKTYLAQVGSYKCNGLAAYFNAYDALTVDVASYNYGSNTSTTAANVASSLNSAAATVNATTNPDGDAGYAAMRAAITASKATYTEGNDDNYYNSTLWATFKSAYEDARSNMTNLTTSGYSTNAAAQTLADRLNTAYNNLVNSVQNVDTTALEAAIDDAEYAIANQAYFTSASVTNADLQNVVNTAKVAVWTSVDKYKSLRAKSQTTEATVNAQLAAVQAAVLKLVINKDYGTPSAGGYSATSVVAHARDTSVYNPTDYANWNTVEAAITTVTDFDPAITAYVDNCTQVEINAYIEAVRGVVTALNDLKDAFSKMKNGQLITEGTMQNAVSIEGTPQSTGSGVTWRTNFWGYDNSIAFRTTHAADYLTLPDSYFSFWDGTDNSSCYGALDTMNMDDTCEWTNQITSGGNGDNESVSDEMINQWGFAGGFVAQNDGTNAKDGRLVFGKVTGRDGTGIFANASQISTARYNVYAVESNGRWINTASPGDAGTNYYIDTVDDENYYQTDLTQMLTDFDNKDETSNDGNHGAWGALYAQKGTTHFKASTSLYVVQENSNTLTKNTKLSIDNYTFTNKNFGATYFWKYNTASTFGYTYHGYRHDYTQYNRTVQVVNVADLFRLINQVENAGYVESEYTNASWTAYTNALAAAKADMDYSGKTAEWVLSQCQTRYDNLWAAKEALVKAADRSALIAARDAVKDVYDAGQQSETYGGPWSDESWTAFANYYQNDVVAKLNGIYSATGVRDYAYYDSTGTAKSAAQQDIETRAARVVELKDALESNADFTPLDDAVAALRTKVNSGNYTTASIANCNSALQAIEYFWYTDAQRKAVYASAVADQAIADAAAAVTAAGNQLVAVDADVVTNAEDITTAVQNILAETNKDPDAYDFEAVKAAIAALGAKTDAVVFTNNSYYGSLSTTGYTWQHMSEVNELVTESLSENFKTYNVNIAGVTDAASTRITYSIGGQQYESTGATLTGVPYGTTIRVYAPNAQYVNWYYTYTSATSGETYKEKYLTNDNVINFVVNGNTTFRLDNETDIASGDKVKVTYANSLRNEAYKVEYVAKGNMELPIAPNFAHYTFVNYTIGGTNYDAGDTVNVQSSTLVIANYDYADANPLDFTIFNMSGDIKGSGNFNAEYNQKVEITLDGLRATTPYVTVDDVQVKIATRNKNYKNSSIYAFTVVMGDDNLDTYDEYLENRGTPEGALELQGIESILTYGDSYTFYAGESMYIIPYTEEEFEYAHGTGTKEDDDKTCYINEDYVDANGATANAGYMFNAGTKMSIVNNFVLPVGCELVEAGILFKATKDGTVPTGDLQFKNVGTNGIVRMKSTQHTVGNQFVISPIQIRDSIKGSTINAWYRAYVTYTGTDGNQHTAWSKPVHATVIA